MREEEKSKIKFNIIIAMIGLFISLVFLILEIFIIKRDFIFWIILSLCNFIIVIGSYYAYKKM